MTYFTCIELLGAEPSDYEALTEVMTCAGFSTTIPSKKKEVYKLPRGVYRCQSQRTTAAVLAVAREIANATNFKNEVITIPTLGARWYPNEPAGEN
ncbi:MAG TPA: hypothetical protein VNB29_05700 [Chthoniobacterales bacterium]|nr:hypothetical protein [Chthoniobacterales bacterium]